MQSSPFSNLQKGLRLTSVYPDTPFPNEFLKEKLSFFFAFLTKTYQDKANHFFMLLIKMKDLPALHSSFMF